MKYLLIFLMTNGVATPHMHAYQMESKEVCEQTLASTRIEQGLSGQGGIIAFCRTDREPTPDIDAKP